MPKLSHNDIQFASFDFTSLGTSVEHDFSTLEDIATETLKNGQFQDWLVVVQAGNVDVYTVIDSGVHTFLTMKEVREHARLVGDVTAIYKNNESVRV